MRRRSTQISGTSCNPCIAGGSSGDRRGERASRKTGSSSDPYGCAVYLTPCRGGGAAAQVGTSPVKVDIKGLVAKIKFEAPIAGFLTDLNGKYKLRVTELTLEPGGYVGEHNHLGPGIRQVTSGQMTYVLPDKTVVYGPGDLFFESGDINHTVFNKRTPRWCTSFSRYCRWIASDPH